MKITFPLDTGWTKYYCLHVQYMIDFLIYGGVEISFAPPEVFDVTENSLFEILIDGITVLVNCSDFGIRKYDDNYKYKIYFHNALDTDISFPPIHFTTPRDRQHAIMNHKLTKEHISFRQRSYGANKSLRTYVREKLKSQFEDEVETSLVSKEYYWLDAINSYCSVHVPGARAGILDRSQLEYMSLGVCTISSELDYRPYCIPDVTYITCKSDYSDIVDKIKYIKANPRASRIVGENASTLYEQFASPHRVVEQLRLKICQQ